jgi:hypothetical protein
MIQDLKAILLRDLGRLRRELEAYPDDAALWRTLPGTANPGGNLALHLAGNLQHFLGARLAGNGYLRDRGREFTARDLPRAQVLAEVEAAERAVEAGLAALAPGDLDRDYPDPVDGRRLRTGEFLVSLCAHLGYHLGQVDYHRRGVAAVGPGRS